MITKYFKPKVFSDGIKYGLYNGIYRIFYDSDNKHAPSVWYFDIEERGWTYSGYGEKTILKYLDEITEEDVFLELL